MTGRKEILIDEPRTKDSGVKEFFFSETLGRYIATQPLKIDERVVKAAKEINVSLSWDDEGRVNNISFVDARRLADKLGAKLLSPSEYWAVYEEALKSGNSLLIKQLQSDTFAEWLDVIYEKDKKGNVFATPHPKIIESKDGIKFEGKREKIEVPEGRPAWFNPKGNIDKKTGFPKKLDLKREKGTKAWSQTTWKYWAVFKINEIVAPIRGYVTSSGTPSLDLDIPVFAMQPSLVFRETREELLEPTIDPLLESRANEFISSYLLTTVDHPAKQNPIQHEVFYEKKEEIFSFLEENGEKFVETREKNAEKIKEKFIDMLGEIKILAKKKGDGEVVYKVDNLARKLFRIKEEVIDFHSFNLYIRKSKEELTEALSENNRIVFVMGHKNPDSDTVVSSIAEAYRNSLLDPETTYIPVIQGARIPDEIKRLLGEEMSGNILLSDDDIYKKAVLSGQARWILVDQNVSEVQRFSVSIVDHHILSDKTKRQDISKTWEMAGSTTALVAQKFFGMGCSFDASFARILYGATLMDTENRSDKKMTYKDLMIMDDLKKAAEVFDDNSFYQDLMSYLLNTDDAERLFFRDYKQDWGIFGFAVAKVKGAFSEKGEVLKKDLLERLVGLAEKNNQEKNFPLTIVKVADYLDDNETINKERVYLIFNKYVLSEFKEKMTLFIKKIIEGEFNGKAKIETGENFVDFSEVGDQLSRKVTAPFLEPVVSAFNEFFYSSKARIYVKREFLKGDEKVLQAAKKLGIELSFDKEGRINNITYHEARQILDYLGLTMMSASEYWKTLKEAEENHDEQMLLHLKSPGFVELLDTVIVDGKYIIDHPKIIKTATGFSYEGEKKEINIPLSLPGLIKAEEIDLNTGFPKVSYSPNEIDKRLWRFWSPDAPYCIVTRGHIFLLDQPALDTKIHPDDALVNLGVRPCCFKVNPPEVTFTHDENGVRAKIKKR